MPQVEYTKAKGLVQKTGSGFSLNQIHTTTGNVTLDQGTTVCVISSNHEVTLPTSPNDGDMIIVMMSAAAAGVLKGDGAAFGDITFNAIGDGAVCVYDGTNWQAVISNA
jgi:hypothetical protein